MKLPNCKRPCKKCPFRKDSLRGWLGRERMTEILSAPTFVCHETTQTGNTADRLQCAGHMLIKGGENEFVRLAQALKIDLQLSGRELIFDNTKQCIEHHGFD